MQKGCNLQFSCFNCNDTINFSLLNLHQKQPTIECLTCKKNFDFSDKKLLSQLDKFVTLCTTLQECQDILSDTSVGIYVKGEEILVPYKLLLTRLNSKLELDIGGKPCNISFRVEPSLDFKSEYKERD